MMPNTYQSPASSNPPTKLKVLLNRFQVLSINSHEGSDLLLCHDRQTGRKAVLIELSKGTSGQTSENLQGEEIHVQGAEVTLIRPHSVIHVENSLFAVSYPSTFTSLAQNLAVLKQTDRPSTEAEAVRIGQALCAGLAAAPKAGLDAVFDPRWIFFETNGALQILTFNSDQRLVNKVSASESFPPNPNGIALLIIQFLRLEATRGQVPVHILDQIKNPALRSVLVQALDGKVSRLDEFGELLAKTHAAPPQHSRIRANLIIGSALVVVLVIGLFTHGSQNKVGQNRERQAAADVREAAYATVTQWRAFVLDYTDTTPPQVPEAEQLFSKADELWTASDFKQAKALYSRANVLYEAGLKVAKEISERRNLAQGARLQAMTVGAGWLRLVASPYVEVPEAVNQAQQAMSTGDFRQLDHQYQDAKMAYDLAAERFQSVPAAQLKALTQKHEARANADRAKYAEQGWKQIAPTAGSQLPDMAKQASTSMAQGQALLTAGKDGEAAAAFQEAHDLYGSATAALIKSMISKQEIMDIRDRAADAAQRWRALSKILNATEPSDIAQAETLLQMADGNATNGKQEQAKTQLTTATEIFEREIAALQDRTGIQCDADMAKTKQLFESLQNQQAGIETNLLATRQSIEKVNLRLLAERAPSDQENLLKDLQKARTAHSIASRLSALCDAVVFAGPKFENAKDSLEHAKTLILQGNKVAAAALSGPAVADLETLTRLPAQTEAYLTQRVGVETMAESALRKIGAIAREQPSIKTNLADADQMLAQAEEQIKSGNADKARQMVNDARLYYESLSTQAEAELLAYAARADSEFRTDTAIAALNELLELNPANEDAKRLLNQVQSKERPHDRIAILEGSWRVNGKSMPKPPSKDDLERVLGKSRALSGNSGFVFDDFGIMAVSNPENGKIMLMTAYYGSPQYEYEPHKAYPGVVEIEGVPIKHDSSMADLVASMSRWNPQITQAQKMFEFKANNFRSHVSYGQATNQIYTVSIGMDE